LPGSREVLVVKRFLAALTCCGLLALSSCSDDSSSSADPPSPTPTSTSSEPSPTQEAETPEEFVRRWVEVDREMQNSGETAEYLRLSRECRPCKAVADQVEGYYSAGGYVKTDGWSIKSINVAGTKRRSQVTINVVSAPTKYVEAEGEPEQELAGGRGDYLLTLLADDATWVLTDLEAVAQ
jgi:hypothetical protein